MTLLADLLSTVFERRYRRETPEVAEDGRPLTEMATALVGSAGETSGLALAREILLRFAELEDVEKLAFFQSIATSMNIDPEAVRTTLDEYERSPSKATYRAFADAAEPARQEFVRRLNRGPGATGTLVKMRADLLRLGEKNRNCRRWTSISATSLPLGSTEVSSSCAQSTGRVLHISWKR